MKSLGVFVGSAAALALVFTGCAKTPPYVQPSASTPPVASVTPSTSAPSASPSHSATAAAKLQLTGTGIGTFNVGAAEADVVKVLTDALGTPDEKIQGEACQYVDGSPWGETLVYDDLVVQFEAKDSKKTSPRSLISWRADVAKPLPSGVAVVDGVPLNLSFKQLQAKYPGAKYLSNAGANDGTKFLRLPNKLIFSGLTKPETLWGGEITVCE